MQSVEMPWQLIATVIAALAGVIGYLFKVYHGRGLDTEKTRLEEAKAHATERERWETREAEIRGECEAKLKAQAEKFAYDLRADRDGSRAHEDVLRREFAEIIERIAAQQAESARSITNVMEKFYDRFVGPRSRH